MPSLDISDRDPSVQDAYRWLVPNTNLPPHLMVISGMFHDVAVDLLEELDDSPQLVLSLHDLTAAKDHAVRAKLS